ncbi:PREDICTED: testis-expressed sequence 33 protein [Chaetura pelagica]|uniref:testis-expressed sequence 33 protein n=1 Tax=Chaetura pelagica TaxID=8897 RepID=UPI000523D430|nr:PREDICTED: testis-expressed sequence 33 protein [Chaetura pelagica]
MDQEVLDIPTSPSPDDCDYVLARSASVEPEEEKQELPLEGLCPSRQETSQRNSSRDAWEISKDPVAEARPKNSTSIKSPVPLSAKCGQNKKQRKESLQTKTPSTESLDSGRLEEEREDSGHEPREGSNTYRHSAMSRQREAEGTKSISSTKEPVTGKHQNLKSRGPESSSKTIKASYEKVKETCNRLSPKESLASLGPDGKAEWKLPLENRKRTSSISDSSKYKSASADELTREDKERRALCEAALIMGQKRIGDRTKMLKNPLDSPPSFADYNHLGFNLRSNIFQGGPLKSQSLMKDSYTPEIIKKAIRDPKNWHGRRTDELGEWYKKHALDLNVQKALEDKYGKKKSKP